MQEKRKKKALYVNLLKTIETYSHLWATQQSIYEVTINENTRQGNAYIEIKRLILQHGLEVGK